MLRPSRTTLVAGATLALLVPVSTPMGALHGAEPAIYLGFALVVLRRADRLRVPPVALVGPILVAALVAAFLLGFHGGFEYVQGSIRAALILSCGLVLIANIGVSREFVLETVLKVSTGLAMLLVLERVLNLTWDATKLFADVDKTYRVAGPLGPGHTASILLAGSYVALQRRRSPHVAAALIGLFLVASRAHVLGLVVMVGVAAIGRRVTMRQVVSALAAVGLAALFVPAGVQRVLAAVADSERQRSRIDLWSEVFRVTDWGDLWAGLGPGRFTYEVDSGTTAHFPHSQYLTPWVELGAIGLVALVVVVVALVRRARRTGTLPFLAGWLVASVVGEFIFGPTVPGALGSLSCWAVVWLGIGQRLVHDRGAAPTPTTSVPRHSVRLA